MYLNQSEAGKKAQSFLKNKLEKVKKAYLKGKGSKGKKKKYSTKKKL